MVSRLSNKSPRVSTSSYAGDARIVLRLRHGQNVKADIISVTIRKYRRIVPTYVRNDNSDSAYQVETAATVTNERRINGLLESNRGDRKAQMVESGIYPGNINPPDGLTKSLSIFNL